MTCLESRRGGHLVATLVAYVGIVDRTLCHNTFGVAPDIEY